MVQLPRYVAFKSKFNGRYLRYVNEASSIQTFLESSEENIVSPYTKFELEAAKCDSSLVNIRCCYNNKYLVNLSPDYGFIVATADKAEEDKSKWTCTLLQPIYDSAKQAYRFHHVYLGLNLRLWRKNNCLYVDNSGPALDLCDLSTVIDWEALLTLPKHIAFKADNGCYLRASSINGLEMLQFDTSDIGNPGVPMETFTTKDGSIRIRSNFFRKFWRKSDNCYLPGVAFWRQGDFIFADSTDATDTDPNTLFLPTQIDTNIIALRNLGNDNFIKRLTCDFVQNGLYAGVDTIDQYSKFE